MRALVRKHVLEEQVDDIYEQWYRLYSEEPFDCTKEGNNLITLYIICGESLEFQKEIFNFENPFNTDSWVGPIAFVKSEIILLTPLNFIRKRLTGKYI